MNFNISCNTRPFIRDNFKILCDVFNKLSIFNIEFHLGHLMDPCRFSINIDSIRDILKWNNIEISVVDGGWCDFITGDTNRIHEQMEYTHYLGCNRIRLFLSPMMSLNVSNRNIENAICNITEIANKYISTDILFETHRGIGLEYDIVKHILSELHNNDVNNVYLVFDPVNFILDDKDPYPAVEVLGEFVKHIHLKGILPEKLLCSFGDGLCIHRVVRKLFRYTNSVGIEYEGSANPLLGLYKSYVNVINFIHNNQENIDS